MTIWNYLFHLLGELRSTWNAFAVSYRDNKDQSMTELWRKHFEEQTLTEVGKKLFIWFWESWWHLLCYPEISSKILSNTFTHIYVNFAKYTNEKRYNWLNIIPNNLKWPLLTFDHVFNLLLILFIRTILSMLVQSISAIQSRVFTLKLGMTGRIRPLSNYR